MAPVGFSFKWQTVEKQGCAEMCAALICAMKKVMQDNYLVVQQ